MAFRRSDVVGPGVVVGQQQQPFAGFIQPAHGRQMLGLKLGQAVENGAASVLVPRCGDQPAWFVEHQVNAHLLSDGCTRDFDGIVAKVHWSLGITANAASQADTTRPYHFGSLTAGAISQFGKGTRKSSSGAWHFQAEVSVHKKTGSANRARRE